MTLWPSLEDSDCATNRAATSVGPPAGKGTTILIVRSGYPSARLASIDDPIQREAKSSARSVPATALRWTMGSRIPAEAGSRGCILPPFGVLNRKTLFFDINAD